MLLASTTRHFELGLRHRKVIILVYTVVHITTHTVRFWTRFVVRGVTALFFDPTTGISCKYEITVMKLLLWNVGIRSMNNRVGKFVTGAACGIKILSSGSISNDKPSEYMLPTPTT